MKTRKAVLFTTAGLLVAALALGAFQSVYAQTGGYDPWGCITSGAPVWITNYCKYSVDQCNPASGEIEPAAFWFDPAQNPAMTQAFLNTFGVPESLCSQGSGMKETGKCKLTDIDAEIYLGTPFEAKWLGRGGHLRFIKPSGEFNYIAKVDVTSGTVMQDGNEYVGQFSARGKVEPGVYTVQCFGPGGTAGLGIKNVEIVGH
jgi:hypothetical protein